MSVLCSAMSISTLNKSIHLYVFTQNPQTPAICSQFFFIYLSTFRQESLIIENRVSIGLDNGLSPIRRQAII